MITITLQEKSNNIVQFTVTQISAGSFGIRLYTPINTILKTLALIDYDSIQISIPKCDRCGQATVDLQYIEDYDALLCKKCR